MERYAGRTPRWPSAFTNCSRPRWPRHPDAVAIVYADQSLTYRELNAQAANQMAEHLQTLGVGPEVLVGLCLKRSPDLAVAVLAVLKAGGAYVPLDPDYPRERLDFMVADSRPTVVLTVTALADKFLGPRRAGRIRGRRAGDRSPAIARTICRVGPPRTMPSMSFIPPARRAVPKAGYNLHRGVSNLLFWSRGALGAWFFGTTVLFKTPVSFDISVEEFFIPLISGDCVVMAKPDGQQETSYLVELIRRRRHGGLLRAFNAASLFWTSQVSNSAAL